jgi:hypothetical protein
MGMTALCLPCGGVAQPRNALGVVVLRLVLGGLLLVLLGELLALVVLAQRVADVVEIGLFSLLHGCTVAGWPLRAIDRRCGVPVAIAEPPMPVAPLSAGG